jgi:signal transduction histidine kinase/CheY-like chemotaxis protein
MARCPAYQGNICSLCCTLDARCDDLCKPEARLSAQWSALLRRLLPRAVWPYLDTGLGHYLLLMAVMVPALALLLGLLYHFELQNLGEAAASLAAPLRTAFVKAYAALLLVGGIVAWWLVLTYKSRQVAQEESNRQTHLLMQEIDSHRATDEQLQKAKQVADLANQAKSRYITAISHELRTPLNSILGYAQILDADKSIPPHRRQAVQIIRKSGDHLLSLIERTLDIARIEGGKLSLEVRALDFPGFLRQIVDMFELQARTKGLDFRYQPQGELPAVVRADERRLRQILLNILGNAVKFTARGGVDFRVRYQREMAHFEIEDSGSGIAPADIERIFEPFARGAEAQVIAGVGAGLGLTISRMLTDVMGGELTLDSAPGRGSLFRVRLFLPQVHGAQAVRELPRGAHVGYVGVRRRILIVDNERVDRELLVSVLAPLGFQLEQAASGLECLEVIPRFQPHLIFMDLAMPGIDGWETIRRIREDNLSDARIAIISANVFDKGLDNDAGIPTGDFITKPVRLDELIDWIGRALELDWVTAYTQAAPPRAVTATPTLPPTEHLRALDELAGLGYVRGLLAKLDQIEELDPAYAGFTGRLRPMARQFQFDAIKDILAGNSHDTA